MASCNGQLLGAKVGGCQKQNQDSWDQEKFPDRINPTDLKDRRDIFVTIVSRHVDQHLSAYVALIFNLCDSLILIRGAFATFIFTLV